MAYGAAHFVRVTGQKYGNGLVFVTTPISPAYGGGQYAPYAGNAGAVANTTFSYSWINYNGRWWKAQKTTTSHNTATQYATSLQILTSTGDYKGDYSFLVLCNPISTATYGRIINQGPSSAGSAFIDSNISGATGSVTAGMLRIVDFNGTSTTGYADAASALDGNVHCFITRRSAGIYTIYRDGHDATTAQSTASTQAIGTSSSGICVGGLFGSTSEDHAPNCNIALTAAWNRALNNTEMFELGRNPFLLFADPTPLYVFQVSGPLGHIVSINQAINRAATF